MVRQLTGRVIADIIQLMVSERQDNVKCVATALSRRVDGLRHDETLKQLVETLPPPK